MKGQQRICKRSGKLHSRHPKHPRKHTYQHCANWKVFDLQRNRFHRNYLCEFSMFYSPWHLLLFARLENVFAQPNNSEFNDGIVFDLMVIRSNVLGDDVHISICMIRHRRPPITVHQAQATYFMLQNLIAQRSTELARCREKKNEIWKYEQIIKYKRWRTCTWRGCWAFRSIELDICVCASAEIWLARI